MSHQAGLFPEEYPAEMPLLDPIEPLRTVSDPNACWDNCLFCIGPETYQQHKSKKRRVYRTCDLSGHKAYADDLICEKVIRIIDVYAGPPVIVAQPGPPAINIEVSATTTLNSGYLDF